MNPKAANTAKPAATKVTPQDKDAARQCLMLADKFLKESDFEKARQEVAKAQKLDPTNAYAYAFLDRISYFEEQRKKSAPPPPPPPAKAEKDPQPAPKPVPPAPQPSPAPPKPVAAPPPPPKPEAPKPVSPPAPKPAPPPAPVPAKNAEPSSPPVKPPEQKEPERSEEKPVVSVPPEQKPEPAVRKPAPEPPPPPPVPKAPVVKRKLEEVVQASRSVIADVVASRAKAAGQNQPPGIAEVLQQVSENAQQHASSAPRGDIESKLDEMRRQIEMLTGALEQERKVREEMNQQKLKGAVNQFRSALESVWKNGAPKQDEAARLNRMGLELGIPEDVVNTVTREVKLDMYSRAVKEVVSKQKLIRNSSRTLEWLRNVYQISLDEYLEYESKFLMDLVADQYKGTILLVVGEEKGLKETGQKLKSMGYAVVNATSPENALEKIEKINPHFILCDMEFSSGHLSGIKFLHVLRANSKFSYTPFILLCGPGDIIQLESSELRPTEGYIQKPLDIDKLGSVMNEKLMAFRNYLSSL